MKPASCSCCQWSFSKGVNKGNVQAEEGRIFGDKLNPCELLPSFNLMMESKTPSSLPLTSSSFDSLFSSPSPDFLQSPISTSSMFSNLRMSPSIPSRLSRLSSMCSLTSCWILSSSEMILSFVFPARQ